MKSRLRYLAWGSLGLSAILCLLVGCSTLQQRRRIPNCKTLFDQIAHGWFRDEQGLYHLTKEGRANDRYGSFNADECLVGLIPNEAERLFGKPDTLYPGRMVYYQTAPCLGSQGPKANGCYYMTIRFDDKGGLEMISFSISHSDYDSNDTVLPPNAGRL